MKPVAWMKYKPTGVVVPFDAEKMDTGKFEAWPADKQESVASAAKEPKPDAPKKAKIRKAKVE
jgi:hypothetical protein